jgi:hypothetical protein
MSELFTIPESQPDELTAARLRYERACEAVEAIPAEHVRAVTEYCDAKRHWDAAQKKALNQTH